MGDITNLVYNGDFANGTDGWSGNNLTVSNGVATLTGNLNQYIFIPLGMNRQYKLTFDLKINENCGKNFYIALHPFDDTKASVIPVDRTNKPFLNACNTTLASALSNGDTTVTLTSGENWPTNRINYQRIGICNKLAWGYNRATVAQPYNSISGNVITLREAWNGGSFAAGTKVSEFESSSTYYHPWVASSSNLPSEWTTYNATFYGRDVRATTAYIQFHTLAYTHNYSMRNIRLECISDYQERQDYDYNITPSITKQGLVNVGSFTNVGMPVRYIRDSITGNTVNSYNHWCEIQVFNMAGENVVLGRDVSINGTAYSNSILTDGIVDSSYLPSGVGSTASAVIDLGFVEQIERIKIWHYYPDGRTYSNNVTEVSVDGTNWIQIYKGEKPETVNGNEIFLVPNQMSVYKRGFIAANDFIEY